MTWLQATWLCALVCLPLGMYLLYRRWRAIAGQEIALAEVVEHRLYNPGVEQQQLANVINHWAGSEVWKPGTEPSGRARSRRTWHVVANFRDSRGDPHVYVSQTASYPPAHRIGEVIRIIYPPGDPAQALSFQFLGYFGWGWWLAGFGLLAAWMLASLHLADWLLLARFPSTY